MLFTASWIGLGARDSLRLEAGLCLYGHDMNQQTSPVEANLLWSISKSRRAGGDKQGGFLGSETVLKHIDQGITQKRVGFMVEGRAPVREGADIVDEAGQVIGAITSGGFSPSLQKPIAMGYVPFEGNLNNNGFPIGNFGKKYKVHLPKKYSIKPVDAVVVPLPFTESFHANTREVKK